jgi:16S rRNA (guanine966-N2)-methyltransferase
MPPGSVRVIGGKWRRALIPVADVPEVRPSPDRVRETLFDWLTPRIPGVPAWTSSPASVSSASRRSRAAVSGAYEFALRERCSSLY